MPDPADRHVLAAAIHTNAQALVTFKLRDLPDHELFDTPRQLGVVRSVARLHELLGSAGSTNSPI